MNNIFALLLAFFICISTYAQISEGGTPVSFQYQELMKKDIPLKTMAAFDLDAIRAEDRINDQRKDIPWRFGYNFSVNLNLKNSGIWETIDKGDRLWRLKISSKNAMSINLIFGEYVIPPGGKVFIYNEKKTHILGAFTEKNNQSHRKMGVDLVPGDVIIVEYFEPEIVAGQGLLSIEQVTHGYRGYPSDTKDYGDSGPCNNNVICPEGAPWQDQISATAMNLVNGNTWCSGAMINNTCQDGTPYYLTADHCLSGSVATWVFRFNYESNNCNPSSDGAYGFTVSGASLKANNSASDFALLELSSPPPAYYNVFYAGWDRSGAVPSKTVGIHHPQGDVKKISFDDEPSIDTVNYGKIVWQISSWNDGTTEGGSSGSPLFDQNQRIVGQLYGGQASCSSLTDDNYGKFSSSWALGGTSSTQLKNWLDMCNTEQVFIDGFDPNIITKTLDAATQSVEGIKPIYCDASPESIAPYAIISNKGLNTISKVTVLFGLDGNLDSTTWTGILPTNAKDTIFFIPFLPPAGDHIFSVTVKNPNDSTDQDNINNTKSVSFKYLANSQPVIYTLKTDNYGSEISWQVEDSSGAIWYSGGSYPDNFGGDTFIDSLCLSAGCYDFIINDSYGDGMDYGTPGTYYFQNIGGDTLASIINVNFGNQEINSFCLEGPSVSINTLSIINCFVKCTGQLQAQHNFGAPPYSYSWSSNSGNQTTQTATGLCAGTYTVIVTDTNNFQDSATIFLSDPDSVSFVLSGNDTPPDTCLGSAGVLAMGGTPPFTFTWETGQTGPSVSGLCTGTYSITVTDSYGCFSIDSIDINENVGIKSTAEKLEIEIFPNPNSGSFQISGNTFHIRKVEIFNILGEQIFSQHYLNESKNLNLDLGTTVSSGMYFIRIENEHFSIIEKILISKNN